VVIDTSAFLAILLNEPDAPDFAAAIERASLRRCSAVTLLEASIVIETRYGSSGLARLDLLLAEALIEVVAFTLRDARSARRAYRRYGKGIHSAGLNFGDCVAYALASDAEEPLLFKGDDFAKTDVLRAISRGSADSS
jgi:ribonuclease VapC